MNVKITSFANPFSFFCLAEKCADFEIPEDNPAQPTSFLNNKILASDEMHGQYIAVLWKNKWTRGVVTMESQCRIWLIDYGIYLQPNEKTVYVDLPSAYKNFPTKVFEASIHGVVPLDKVLTHDCGIKNVVTNEWNIGSITKAQSLIASAKSIFFVPVALMSTKHNDVVIGDLYLKYEKSGNVNIIDEMELWPVFLEKNRAAYIENINSYYTSRRKHRFCQLKPEFVDANLPVMNLETTFPEYNAICEAAPQLEPAEEYERECEDGSTLLEFGGKSKSFYKLTPSEIEKYLNKYVTVCERESNITAILNKVRDLHMCEQYKDYDLKSVGRASYKTPINEDYS